MKEYYIFYLFINDSLQEMIRLRFIGTAGQNKWLHFQNPKTKENHLCDPNHFPMQTIKGRENSMVFRYEEDNGTVQLSKPKRPVKKEKQSRFFQHSKRWL